MRSRRALSFSELIKCHGSIRKILDFQIVSPEELREKLDLEKNKHEKIPPKLLGAEGEISGWELLYQETMLEMMRV